MSETWGIVVTALVPVVLALGGAIGGAFRYLYKQTQDLHAKSEDCEKRYGRLEGLVINLQADNERKSHESNAVIVIDAHGLIREWSPGATLLFHWPQREILGKHVSILMPERFRCAFEENWQHVLKTGRAPRRGPHDASGKTKEGEEVPLRMWYSSWADGTFASGENYGERLFGATIQFRVPGDDDENPAA